MPVEPECRDSWRSDAAVEESNLNACLSDSEFKPYFILRLRLHGVAFVVWPRMLILNGRRRTGFKFCENTSRNRGPAGVCRAGRDHDNTGTGMVAAAEAATLLAVIIVASGRHRHGVGPGQHGPSRPARFQA